jgi:UDP-glucuronate decarboxylase
MLSNSLGTLNVLEASRKHESTILYTSTSEVYGDADVIPTPETYWGKVNPVGVRSCYDESKRFSEALCTAYHRQYGLDIKIVRIFNVYGPRLDPNASYARVVSRFIIQALKNEPITIHGNGTQTRSFCYISDTVNALIRMLPSKRLKGEVVNIGSPNEITILDLAKMVKKLTESKSPFVFLPPRPDDPKRRCPEISKAKQLLGWMPKISLKDGLRRTIKWFKNEMIK